MSRYFFDIHNTGAARWDADGELFDDLVELELRARELVAENVKKHDGEGPVCVSVLREGGGVVLTAVADGTDGIHLSRVKQGA